MVGTAGILEYSLTSVPQLLVEVHHLGSCVQRGPLLNTPSSSHQLASWLGLLVPPSVQWTYGASWRDVPSTRISIQCSDNAVSTLVTAMCANAEQRWSKQVCHSPPPPTPQTHKGTYTQPRRHLPPASATPGSRGSQHSGRPIDRTPRYGRPVGSRKEGGTDRGLATR